MLDRPQWAERLNARWAAIVGSTVAEFLDLGHDLLLAKAELSAHGQWMAMVSSDLTFNIKIVQRFMRIATWSREKVLNEYHSPILGCVSLQELLPPDYNTIDQVRRLDDEAFDRLVADGTICPTLQRNEIAKILRLLRVTEDERRVLSLVPIEGRFRTLVFDPAWEYEALSLAGRAKPGYAMQTLEDLWQLDIQRWAEPECHLYCWATNNFVYEASKLVEHWGFQHRTMLMWLKPPPFGLGSYFRNSTEPVLFATLGETTTRPAAASIPTHFEAPRGEHSEKPERFYDIVRAASYPPYGEGNQRQARPDFANLFKEVEDGRAAAE